jgi:hypothetical protein
MPMLMLRRNERRGSIEVEPVDEEAQSEVRGFDIGDCFGPFWVH